MTPAHSSIVRRFAASFFREHSAAGRRGFATLLPISRTKLLLLFLLCVVTSSQAHSASDSAPPRPQILVLGVFHLLSTNNMLSQTQIDTLSAKRQSEIKEVVERLRAFHPTKIAVEHDYAGDLNTRYQRYLRGDYILTAEETDQFAFCLGKELGLSRIESIYYPVSFDPSRAGTYATAHDQKKVWDAALGQAHSLVDQLNHVLASGTILDALRFFNSKPAIDQNASIYLLLDRIGGGDEYPGADSVSQWYNSNLHIFANLTRLASRPDDRILVIYGQGHVKLLRSFIEVSPDLECVDPLSVLR
jgi:hypothetical protein